MKRRSDHRDPAAILFAILAMLLVVLVPVHAASPGHAYTSKAVSHSHVSGGSHTASHGAQHQYSHDHVQETLDELAHRSDLPSTTARQWFSAHSMRRSFDLKWLPEQPPRA